jgi:tetratricopeptide (TPR) repeat protein
MADLVGTTLGRYQIVERIGEGGMADVYKAWQPSLRRHVALKVLARHLASNAEFVQRFHQEAVSAANLKHPHIVTIHDVGVEDGYHYIAMELVEGTSLEERIRSGPALTLDQVVDVISQVSSALDYAHERGFIHRDIRPANILIDASGRAVLTDFGIVKALSGSGVTEALTQAGTIFGTPRYMSPEQVKDEPLDYRSDLYALGVVCYEMLSGQVPFDGNTTHSILYAQVHNSPPPLREFAGPGVPPPVEAVVGRMLAKEREARYNSAGEFARELAQAVAGEWPAGTRGETVVVGGMGTGTAVIGGTPPGVPPPTVRQPMEPFTPPPAVAPARRSRWPLTLGLAAGGLVVLLVLAVVAVRVLGPWVSLNRAHAALDAGDYTRAAERFGQVLERDTESVEAMEGLLEAAASLAQAGQLDRAIEAYETVRQARPGEVQALRGLGQAYAAKGEWDEAAGWYEKWTQAAPEDGGAFLALGGARFNLGEYERAVAEYKRAELLGASSAEMDEHLGLAYFELAQYENAVGHLQNGVGQNPDDVQLQRALGLAYFELARYGEAVGHLQNAVDQNPDDFQLQRALGVSLYDQGQPGRAMEHLNKAVALGAGRSDDDLVDVYYALGGSYFRGQDYEQAISFYEQAQALDPEGHSAWADKAQANLDQTYSRLAQNVMEEALLDLDFSDVVTEGDEIYAIARTGQRVEIEGAVHLVGGLREASPALMLEVGTENLITNPSFEDDVTTDWRLDPKEGGAVARYTADSRHGSASCLVTAASSKGALAFWQTIPVTEALYVFSVWAKDMDANTTPYLWVRDSDTGSVIVTMKLNDLSTAEWRWYTLAVSIPLGTTQADFGIRIPEHAAQGGFLVDAVQVEQKPYATTYCDGDQGNGYSWSNAPHASSSTRAPTLVSLSSAGAVAGAAGSVSVWWRPGHASDVDYHRYLFDLRDGTTDWGYLYWDYEEDSYSFSGLLSDVQLFPAGGWQHVVVTWEPGARGIYVNGVLESSDSVGQPGSVPDTLYIGSRYSRAFYTNGAVAEFATFDRALTAGEVTALYRICLSACNIADRPNDQPTDDPITQPVRRGSPCAIGDLQEAAYYYRAGYALAPGDLLGLRRLAEVCAVLEEAGAEDASCREVAERVAAGQGDRGTEGREEGETQGSPAAVLWAGWLERAATAEPGCLVGQELDSGWTFLGYDVDEERLIRGEPVDLLLYWEGPGSAHAGSERDGWYRAGARWVQVLEGARNLASNGGFELGVEDGSPTGFPGDIYRAGPDTRRLVADSRAGRRTTVALLDNTAVYSRTSFASTWLPVDADRLYVQAGWMRSAGGQGYLGRRWAGDIAEGVRRYSYVAMQVGADGWHHYAGLARPLEGATRCQIWVLNFKAVGRVYFDNVLFVEVGRPGK